MRTHFTSPRHLLGMRDIASGYRGVILDLWGVVHDGVAAYPEAIEALQHLRASGVTICLLSNAPRRVAEVADKLDAMGVAPQAYDHLITSGEETFAALSPSGQDNDHTDRRYFHLGPPFLEGLLSGAGHRLVPAMKDAQFILCTGTDRIQAVDDVLGILTAGVDQGLPMICANPDLTVFIGDQHVLCAGSLAARYEGLGGQVLYHGKPHKPVYDNVLDRLDLQPSEVLAVGDSLRTDVAGANAAQIDVAFVTGGIHRDELAVDGQGHIDLRRLAELIHDTGARPQFVLSRFCW